MYMFVTFFPEKTTWYNGNSADREDIENKYNHQKTDKQLDWQMSQISYGV